MFVQCLIHPATAEEPQGSSITEVGERLDIERMLSRAAQGILDLTLFKDPSGHYDGDKPDDIDIDGSDISDHVFGVSRETAVDALENAERTVASELAKIRKKTEDQPGEAAPGAEA